MLRGKRVLQFRLERAVGRVMALFGKGAPLALRTVSDGEVPGTPLDDEEEEGSDEED